MNGQRNAMTANPATEAIWSQLSDDLRRFIRRRVANEHVGDDLLQETFLRIHGNVDKVKETDRLAAWVYQIARNVIHDHYRAKNGDVSLADMDVAEEDDEKSRLRASASLWLEDLINQLSPTYQEAVRLSEIEGLPQQMVAERLGLSASGAKSRIQRGRVMLRDVLDQCCVIQFDRQGNLMDCDPKPDRTVCGDCDELELPPI
jgi:RNA polymerase sigma-70 factor, ECF subfamily